MAFQVGASCYATAVDAGSAACASYGQVSHLVADGGIVRTVSCTAVDPSSGALSMQIVSTPVDGSPSTTAYVSQLVAFPACIQTDYVAAFEVIFGALLALAVMVWGPVQIMRFLGWGRGEPE